MTIKPSHILIVAIVLVGIGGTAFYLWLQEHDARLIAESKNAVLEQQRQQVQADTKQQVVQEKHEREAAQTLPQQAIYIGRHVGIEPPVIETMPNSDLSFLKLPSGAAPKLADYVGACEQSKVELNGCRKELAIVEQQRDLFKKQAGATFWHKAAECGLRIGIGAGAGALSGKKNLAIAGAGVGAGSCFIRF